MVGQEAARGVVIDQRVVDEPLDSAALGTYVAERVPRRQQLRVLVVEFILEPTERSPALDSPTLRSRGRLFS